MKFAKPMPFKEALKASQQKTLLPTNMTAAQLNELDVDIRERSRFSARVRSVDHLAVIDDGVNDLTSGHLDVATARLRVKQFLANTGYKAPEGKEGGLQDFSSDRRINLQLLVNVQQAQGYGWWKQGQDTDLLFAFPAREFVRVEDREVPRTDWAERWNAARAATTTEGATDAKSGRMVALTNHPIWAALSVFGTPYEPFDYMSGMGTEDVSRREAIELGIIEPNTNEFPQDRPFNQGLQATPAARSSTLKSLLNDSGVGRFEGDVFVYAPKGGDN